ncbi:MAG: hypothetical protein HFI63_11535 [Lachnospiraceae bacterium]|nr:hypothetical protein [Lachnospiraceae bacterium]
MKSIYQAKFCNVYSILTEIFILFSTTTLLYNILNAYIPINRILGLLILCLTGVLYIKHCRKKDLAILLISTVLFISGLFRETDFFSDGLDNAIYWYSTIFILCEMTNPLCRNKLREVFYARKGFIKIIVLINALIIITGFFLSSCYNTNWGGKYYVGFAYSNHVLACGCCMSMCLALWVIGDIKNDWLKLFVNLPFALAILQCGARTYLVPVLIVYFLTYKLYIKKISSKLILVPFIILVGIYGFIHSGLMDKFINPNSYSRWSGINLFTNGRTVFWLIDLDSYFHSSLSGVLFGNGFGFSYHINSLKYGREIWAHNDFIEVLISTGIIGFTAHMYVLIKNFDCLKKHTYKLTMWCVILYYVFVAFINGTIIYQHYIYSFIILELLVEHIGRFQGNKVLRW